MRKLKKLAPTSNLRLLSFRGTLQRLSVALLTLVMTLTAQTAWADNVMYVIATELSGNITITQENGDGSSSNLSVKKVKLTFYYGERPTSYDEGSEVWSLRTESFGGSCIFDVPTAVPTSNDENYPAWYVNTSSKNAARRHEAVTQISFDASFADALPKSTAYWFYNMKNLTSSNIDFTNLNTSSTKSMYRMFCGCQGIMNLDLSGWNVANVTDMRYMFSRCFKLNTIKLVRWNVTSLQYASGMFAECEKLTYIYCDGDWDTSKLTNSSYMFSKCTSLPGYKSAYVNNRKAKPQPDGYFTSTGLTWNASDGYYEINDEQDLIDLANYVNAGNDCAGLTFKMTADLDFTNMPKDLENGKGNFLPIGFRGKSFYGHFDGQNHSITGLYFNGASPLVGLFCIINNSGIAVENVTLVNPNITAETPVGGIVASMNAGTISNCAIVGGSITGSCNVGGIMGDAKNTTVSGCSVIGTSITATDIGSPVSIIASVNNGGLTISNCNYNNIANGLSICGSSNPYTDGGGNQQVYQVTLGEGITAASPAFAYGNKAYYAENATVTLGTNRTGYVASGYQSNDMTISNGSFTMPASDVSINANWADPNDISVNAAVDEYTIKTAAGWGVFCDLLTNNAKGYFSGKTVKLNDNIGTADEPITRMAGASHHDFTGTFDGQGHTLTVDYNTGEQYAAPFRNAENGCVIENLHVAGTIATSAQNAAGVIANQFGTVTIRNCRVSVTISSSKSGDGTHGGFVGIKGNSDDTKLTIEDCVFDGKIVSTGSDATTDCGGFVGWRKDKGSLTITNCLYVPQTDANAVSTGATFARNGGTITNCYYTQMLGDEQGAKADYLLSETATVPSTLSGTVVFRREFKGGKASTICLPFAYTPDANEGTYYSFAGIEKVNGIYVATMAAANTAGSPLTANTPYVFMPNENVSYVPVLYHGTADYDANALTATSGNWTFKGTYSPLAYKANGTANLTGHVYGFASKTKYVDGEGEVQAGEFVHAKDGASVPPMRCYLTYKNGSQFAGTRGMTRADEDLPQTITVRFVDTRGEVTAIGTLNTQTGEIVTDGWYTLNGTKLSGKPSKRGVYINNGRKIVIK